MRDPVRAEWRAGWPLPLASALGLAVSVTHIYTAGLFIAPLEQEFGWSRTAITSGLSIISLFSVCLAPFMGMAIDRWGSRRIGLPGILLYCGAVASLSLATGSLWSWWALWVLLALGSICTKATVWTTAVASRFDEARGFALAITLCGAGVGSAVLPIMAVAFLSEFGWRGAYVAMGAVLAAVSVPVLFFFFYDAGDTKGKAEGTGRSGDRSHLPGLGIREAMLSTRYLRLAVASLAAVSAVTALMVHLVPILSSRGMDMAAAAAAASLVGIGSVTGRLGAGYLLDRMSGPLIGAIAFTMPILVALALLHVDASPQMAMPIAFLLGLSVGGEVDVIAYLTTRFFGLRNFGTLFGTLVGMQSLAVGIGPVLAGYVYDQTASYDWVLIGVVPVFALAALMVGTLGRYPVLRAPAAVPAAGLAAAEL